MAISEFTREVCRGLCVEKAIETEIKRLHAKGEAMKRGPLTQADIDFDNERRDEAKRLLDIGAQSA